MAGSLAKRLRVRAVPIPESGPGRIEGGVQSGRERVHLDHVIWFWAFSTGDTVARMSRSERRPGHIARLVNFCSVD